MFVKKQQSDLPREHVNVVAKALKVTQLGTFVTSSPFLFEAPVTVVHMVAYCAAKTHACAWRCKREAIQKVVTEQKGVLPMQGTKQGYKVRGATFSLTAERIQAITKGIAQRLAVPL